MSDVAYIMETQDPKELWLIDGENRFRVSRDMYLLLASNGADLPPTYGIADMLEENAKLKEERDHWRVEQVHAYGNWEDAHERATELEAENAKLRERITTQKQTIQSYRDESREWREAAEHAQAENAKLRELVRHLHECMCDIDADGNHECYSCDYEDGRCDFERLMRELGIEVDE